MSNFFNLSLYNLFVQALGFIGVICSIISFQCKKHKQIILFRTLNELFFGVQYTLLGAYTGAAMNAVGCVRNICFSKQVEKGKSTTVTRIIFSVLFIAFSIATRNGTKSILIGLAKVASTFAYGCKNTLLMRVIILATSTAWLIYNVMIFSIAGVFCEAFTICSIIIALARIRLNKL